MNFHIKNDLQMELIALQEKWYNSPYRTNAARKQYWRQYQTIIL